MAEDTFSTNCALSGLPGSVAVFSSAKAGLFVFQFRLKEKKKSFWGPAPLRCP